MPTKPKPVCYVCLRRNCTDPTHIRKPFADAVNVRPRYRSAAETKRRRETVKAWRAQYGDYCPRCGRTGVKLTADHLHPVGLGGSEHGTLGVACIDCQRSQGARVANERRRGAAKKF